jgi:SAM-dependent methyltransferase
LTLQGTVEYVEGFKVEVFDCAGCGCRLTPHDPAVHDLFHRYRTLSYYDEYDALAIHCQSLFNAGDAAALRQVLQPWAKYRFVIEQVERLPRDARILEVGASRGYLTAFLRLCGWDARGIDVSPVAVEAAQAAFGGGFAVAGRGQPLDGPYDAIFHVGLIGCVADPLGLTRELLRELKPGGRLFFNAPNREALRLRQQLWMDSAPPPDLGTLFPPGFWTRQFPNASVDEVTEVLPPDASLALAARELVGVRWRPPVPLPMTGRAQTWTQPRGGARDLAARALARAGRAMRLARVAAPRPHEFGLFVTIESQ